MNFSGVGTVSSYVLGMLDRLYSLFSRIILSNIGDYQLGKHGTNQNAVIVTESEKTNFLLLPIP